MSTDRDARELSKEFWLLLLLLIVSLMAWAWMHELVPRPVSTNPLLRVIGYS